MENSPAWHGGIPSGAQFESALAELEDGAAKWRA